MIKSCNMLLRSLLISVLCFSTIPVISPDSSLVANASEGTPTWVLTEHTSEYGETTDETGSVTYKLKENFNEDNGLVSHSKVVKVSNSKKSYSTTFISTCNVLENALKGGSKISLNIISVCSGNSLNGAVQNNYVEAFYETETGDVVRFKRASDGKDVATKIHTGPKSDYKLSARANYSAALPKGKELGETLKITFQSRSGEEDLGAIRTVYTYTWQVAAKAPVKAIINKLTAEKSKLTVKAKKISKNCQGYEYQISTSQSFKSFISKNSSSNKVTFTKLKKNKKYYVRIRGYNKAKGNYSYGKWSRVKSIKVK